MEGLKFRVLLDHKEENEIFRDIILPKTATFQELNDIILKSFNFSGLEMSSFYWSNDEWDKGKEMPLMDMNIDESHTSLSMKDVSLETILTSETKKLLYLYDFLRMWIFYVDFIGEAHIDAPVQFIIPVAIGDAPKEDSKEIDLGDDNIFDDQDSFYDEFDDEFDNDTFTSLDELDFEEHGF